MFKSFQAYFFLLLIVLSGTVTSINAQSAKQKELENQRAALLLEMKQLQRLRESNKKEEISLLSQVEDLDQQIKVRQDLIKVTNRQANLLTREINENLNKMENLREELKALKTDYAAMIKKSYKSKNDQSRVMFLLSSENFAQAYKRMQYMKQYANYRKKQGEQIKERTALLQEVNTKLIAQKKDKENLIAENKKAKAQLDKEKKQQDELVDAIRKKESMYAAQIRQKQKERDKIDREIDKIIAAAIAASNKKVGKKVVKGSSTKFALTAEAKALAADFTSNKGKLPWPVERGRVTRRFGKSAHPTLPGITVQSAGVDIETLPNAQARASFKGEVIRIQEIPGGKYCVYLRHGDYITTYYGLKNLKVKTGDKVATKEALGEVGVNAFSGKALLKFRIQKNTTKLNPASWVINM